MRILIVEDEKKMAGILKKGIQAENHRVSLAYHLARRLDVPPSGDELQRLSETLNRMLERLEASFRRITQFTAGASDELRTPICLDAICKYAQGHSQVGLQRAFRRLWQALLERYAVESDYALPGKETSPETT